MNNQIIHFFSWITLALWLIISGPCTICAMEPMSPCSASQSENLKVSYTQSMGYLKAYLGDAFIEINPDLPLETIKLNIQKFYELRQLTDYLDIRTNLNHPNLIPIGEALLEEHASPNKDFSYHGAAPVIGLLYDIYAESRRQLLGINSDNLFLCRGTDQLFSDLENVADFIHEQIRKQHKKSFRNLCNYAADYAEKALSVNLFLFGNCGTAFDDTIKFFIEGTSDRTILLRRSLAKFFVYLGIDLTQTEGIEELISEFENLPLLDRGRLFQFSFASGTIDDFIYLSESLGRGVTTDWSQDYDLNKRQVSSLLEGMRQDPVNVKKYSEQIKFDAKRDTIRPFNLDIIQGRFLPHPRYFCEDSPLRVKSYWRGLSSAAPEVIAYKTLLKDLVSKIASLALKSKVILPRSTFLTDIPYHLISKTIDMPDTASSSASEHLLSAYICSGDLAQVKQSLISSEYCDINKSIIDINDLENQTNYSPIYLGVKYNHRELVNYLLSMGARIENEEADGRSLIGWACMNGYPEIAESLLNSGSNPNSTFRVRLQSNLIATVAMEYGQNEVLELLITSTKFAATSQECSKILNYIIESEKTDLLKLSFKLFSKNLNMNVSSKRSPLNIAIRTGNPEVVRILLKECHQAVSLEPTFGTPAIIEAIDVCKLPVIMLLVDEFGADLRKEYPFYGTPLKRAQTKKDESIIAFIQSRTTL